MLRRNKSEVKSKIMTETNEVAFSLGVVVLTFFCFLVFRFFDYGDVFSATSFSSVFLLIYFTDMSSQNNLLTVLNTC